MNRMLKFDMLFIRACKSKRPIKRVYRLYKMLFKEFVQKSDLVAVLANVCDRCLASPTYAQTICMLNPHKCGDSQDKDYFDICLEALIRKIRHTNPTEIKGYIKPAYWRNKK